MADIPDGFGAPPGGLQPSILEPNADTVNIPTRKDSGVAYVVLLVGCMLSVLTLLLIVYLRRDRRSTYTKSERRQGREEACLYSQRISIVGSGGRWILLESGLVRQLVCSFFFFSLFVNFMMPWVMVNCEGLSADTEDNVHTPGSPPSPHLHPLPPPPTPHPSYRPASHAPCTPSSRQPPFHRIGGQR